ncbi:MogA/MoaB family molybdenum cofactor biosynthesis protein [Corynebacterium heidelbergense]|uniref:Molybdenum cofactor biosynthesis protein n=1 Tax=Corynebacterium heidelbergense TaxID=2055947 RepID=A0A364VBG6_9CORY|nr:MogA/MoaB family molybdenum cofactor biosynthesis protein [Corynebacterium heidelbergense]RAV33995.1 molybdenum cofactor biosynthesis protein [Corynebacterium heidelbergense]WCZ37131.1 Molybdenum cofactor biosynthesis protein B [Corynebacterium heidelbergense]
MSPRSGQSASQRVAIPSVDNVDHSDLDRLAAEVVEPDAAHFRTLDAERRVRHDAGSSADHHALVVLISDNPSDPQASGDLVAELLAEESFIVDAVLTVESRKSIIRNAIETAVVGGADLVVTIGGTGMGSRDRAPEATRTLLDRKIPGIAEAIRSSGLSANSMDAALSRGVAGVSGSTVVVNLAGSRGAIRDGMATLCPLVRHVLDEMSS